MRIATWNVRTLYRALAMNELVKEMEKYSIGICVLQEIRWPGKGTEIKKNCTILYSGHLLLSLGLQVANAPDVLQPCGLLYYP